MFTKIKWIIQNIPKAPKRAGILMNIYYGWVELFTPAGHATLALLLLSFILGLIPGFFMSWIFCGILFLFFLALVPSLFLTARKNKIQMTVVEIPPVFENEKCLLRAHFIAFTNIDTLSLNAFRLNPEIKTRESSLLYGIKKGDKGVLECEISPPKRGVFEVKKIAFLIPEIKGMMRYFFDSKKGELIVYPRPKRITRFSFLTSGISGQKFAPLLMHSFERGFDFASIREYREGDSIKDIHHKAFARYGKPFTKEFEKERGEGIILFLDLHFKNLKERMLQENLIRLCAGIICYLKEKKILGRFFIGNDEFEIDSFLDVLARVECEKFKTQKNEIWAPSGLLGPVLRLGLQEVQNDKVDKQIILSFEDKTLDKILFLNIEKLNSEEILL